MMQGKRLTHSFILIPVMIFGAPAEHRDPNTGKIAPTIQSTVHWIRLNIKSVVKLSLLTPTTVPMPLRFYGCNSIRTFIKKIPVHQQRRQKLADGGPMQSSLTVT